MFCVIRKIAEMMQFSNEAFEIFTENFKYVFSYSSVCERERERGRKRERERGRKREREIKYTHAHVCAVSFRSLKGP